MGTFGYTVFNVLFYVAAHHTSAINLGIIQAVMPIFIFLIAFVRFRTPVTSLQVRRVMRRGVRRNAGRRARRLAEPARRRSSTKAT